MSDTECPECRSPTDEERDDLYNRLRAVEQERDEHEASAHRWADNAAKVDALNSQLRAENARLRAALQEIASKRGDRSFVMMGAFALAELVQIAERALAGGSIERTEPGEP